MPSIITWWINSECKGNICLFEREIIGSLFSLRPGRGWGWWGGVLEGGLGWIWASISRSVSDDWVTLGADGAQVRWQVLHPARALFTSARDTHIHYGTSGGKGRKGWGRWRAGVNSLAVRLSVICCTGTQTHHHGEEALLLTKYSQ